MRVLVVGEEIAPRRSTAAALEAADFDVVSEGTGEGAYFRLVTEWFDVLLLVGALAVGQRDALLHAVRERHGRMAALVIGPHDDPVQRDAALEAGVEYLAAPSDERLHARIRAIGRARPPHQPRITVGAVTIDFPTRTVLSHGVPVSLTRTEFDVLACLASRAGAVVSREELAREVWTTTADTAVRGNVINVLIARLRQKLRGPDSSRVIQTVRGEGFRLEGGGGLG